MAKAKKSQPEKKITTEFYGVNITVQSSARKGPEMYEKIFRQIFDNKRQIDVGYGKGMILMEMNLLENEDGGETYRFFYGQMAKFTIIENNDWLDLENRVKTTHNLPPNLFPNLVVSEYVFIPYVHRFYFKTNSKITINNVVDYFQEALKELVGENEKYAVNQMSSKDVVDRILKAEVLMKLVVDLSYTNSDLNSDAKETLDDLIKVADAAKVHIELTPADKSKGLDTESTLVEGLVELAQENGYAQATIKEVNQKRSIKINTKNHPKKTSVETLKTGQPFWELVKKLVKARKNGAG